MELVDIGVNLANGQFRNDLNEVVARAQRAGLSKLITIGTDLATTQACLALAEQHSGYILATAGVHPHDADNASDAHLKEIATLAQNPCVCALGEMGLDFNRNYSTPENQLRVFEAQLAIATDIDKPVFLHERDAFKEQHERLKAHRSEIQGGVAHCFTGTLEQLRVYLELDLYIGVTGWVSDPKRGKSLREALPYIPHDRLLLETDAPFLLPRGFSKEELGISEKRRNEPCSLPAITRFVADELSISAEELAAKTTINAKRLFNL